MSRIPNPTPIFLRKAFGGSPPAKIQTKSLGSSCNFPLTSRTTECCLNSAGTELKITVTFPLRMQSSIRCAFRSLMRKKASLQYDKVTLLPTWYASPIAASTALSPPPHHEDFLVDVMIRLDQTVHDLRQFLSFDSEFPRTAAPTNRKNYGPRAVLVLGAHDREDAILSLLDILHFPTATAFEICPL